MSKTKVDIKDLIGSKIDKKGEPKTEPPSDDKWIIIVLIIIVVIAVLIIPNCGGLFPDYPRPNGG